MDKEFKCESCMISHSPQNCPKKEFRLDEKECFLVNIKGCSSKNIKEFIKKTEEDMRNHKLSRMGMVERFKKRAGDGLING